MPLIERLLPRHMQIIYEINADILSELRSGPASTTPIPADVSLIDESDGRRVRMGHLAFVGAHKVNGVSALHTELMKQTVFHDLHRAVPRPDQQQDQRHHAAPLAAPVQPGAAGR